MGHTQFKNYAGGQNIRKCFCIRALLSHKCAPEGFVMPELCLRHSPAQELSAAVSPCQATAGEGKRMKAPETTSTHTHKQEHTTAHYEKNNQHSSIF